MSRARQTTDHRYRPLIDGKLTCCKCGQSKPGSAFNWRSDKPRLHSWCIRCKRFYDAAKIRARRAVEQVAA